MRAATKREARSDAADATEGVEIYKEGERNNALTSLAGKLRAAGVSRAGILHELRKRNKSACQPPLDDSELKSIARSIAKRPAGTATSKKRDATAEQLVVIGSRSTLFRDERGTAWAAIPLEIGSRRPCRLANRTFKNWLGHTYYAESGKVAPAEAKNSAIGILENMAMHGTVVTLYNRFAVADDSIWLDLCDDDYRAIRVRGSGWKLKAKPPLLFRRYTHQQALPEPGHGGDLSALRPFLNVANEDAWTLLVCWLVLALRADIPRPILWLHGSQGSAKTTAAQILRSLVDPSELDASGLPSSQDELAQVLDHNAVPVFDNVSTVHQWQADVLCKAVTGGGFSKRELYSDDGDVIFKFKRAIIITGINIATVAPDLLERCLLLPLKRIDPHQRKEQAKLWRQFEAARPRILAGLLDALASAIRIYPTLSVTRLERMADFMRWGMAVAEAVGIGAKAFKKALRRNTTLQRDEVVDGDPVCQALLKLVKKESRWSGTATQLSRELDRLVHESTRRSSGWPRSQSYLSRRIRRLETVLAECGVVITFSRGRRQGRIINIEAVEQPQQPSSSSSSSSRPGGATERNDDDSGDGEDAEDAGDGKKRNRTAS